MVGCLLYSAALNAQPVVAEGGALNAASFTRVGLPGDGLARGGMFAVFGQGIGPATLDEAEGIPLTTQLAGTSIAVTVGGTTVSPFMLFTSSLQLAAVLPSNTPLGVGSLTVTFNGQTSAPVTVTVVESAFGIFTRNRGGFGPASLQNFVSPGVAPLNSLQQAAQPGQVVILWGTGLGPIQGSDAGLPPIGNLPLDVDVIVGGVSVVKPQYAGRSPQFPGIDQINFPVPAGIEGCFVSVAVRANGVISNYSTMAISSSGRFCDDPFTAEQMMLAEQNGRLRVGSVTLVAGGGQEPGLEAEAGEYSLALLNQSTLTFVALDTHVTPVGSCTVWPVSDDFFPVDPLEPIDLAGGDLTVTTPAGTLTENDELPVDFFPPGLVTVRSTAGPGVGAFELSLTLPPPGTLNSPIDPQQVNRSQDLTFRWSGVDSATDFVLILGRSADQTRGVGRSFVCSADAAAGQFTVPSQVLQNLPRSVAAAGAEEPPGQIVVGSARKSSAGRKQVDGIDAGFFVPIQLFGQSAPMFE